MAFSDLRGQSLNSINDLLGMKNQRRMQRSQNISNIGSQLMNQQFTGQENEADREARLGLQTAGDEAAAERQAAADEAAYDRAALGEEGATERTNITAGTQRDISADNVQLQRDLETSGNQAALDQLVEKYRLAEEQDAAFYEDFEDGPINITDFTTGEDVTINSPAEFQAYLEDKIAKRQAAMARLEASLRDSGSGNDSEEVWTAFMQAREYVRGQDILYDAETNKWMPMSSLDEETFMRLAEKSLAAQGLDESGYNAALDLLVEEYRSGQVEEEPGTTPPGEGRSGGIVQLTTPIGQAFNEEGDGFLSRSVAPLMELFGRIAPGASERLMGPGYYPDVQEEERIPEANVTDRERDLFTQLIELLPTASPQEQALASQYINDITQRGTTAEITTILDFLSRAGLQQSGGDAFQFNRRD